jgi:hypothetical protein
MNVCARNAPFLLSEDHRPPDGNMKKKIIRVADMSDQGRRGKGGSD